MGGSTVGRTVRGRRLVSLFADSLESLLPPGRGKVLHRAVTRSITLL